MSNRAKCNECSACGERRKIEQEIKRLQNALDWAPQLECARSVGGRIAREALAAAFGCDPTPSGGG